MWFSPGILAAGVLVLVVYEVTGSVAYWWLVLLALALSLVVDAMLGIHAHKVPKVKTRTEYTKD